MVSKASEDFPDPDSPVNTTSRSRGISRSMFLRLCSRAPRIAITRPPSTGAGRRGRSLSNRSVIGSVGAIRSARSRSVDFTERSENGGLSPAREGQARHSATARLWTTRRCRHHCADDVGIDGRRLEHSNERSVAFALGNFTLTFFVLGLLASAIPLWRTRQPRTPAVVLEVLFSYFLLFSIAFANLYNFVLHAFFGKIAAAFIGWEDSPFQLEVGFAALGLLAF